MEKLARNMLNKTVYEFIKCNSNSDLFSIPHSSRKIENGNAVTLNPFRPMFPFYTP